MTLQVKDLVKPDLTSMSNAELQDYISSLRRRRMVRKVEEPKEKASTVKTKSKLDQLKALLAGMTPEQRAELGIGGDSE